MSTQEPPVGLLPRINSITTGAWSEMHALQCFMMLRSTLWSHLGLSEAPFDEYIIAATANVDDTIITAIMTLVIATTLMMT